MGDKGQALGGDWRCCEVGLARGANWIATLATTMKNFTMTARCSRRFTRKQ
jgi:hypothetical protein